MTMVVPTVLMLVATHVLLAKTACFFPIQFVCHLVRMVHIWPLLIAVITATTSVIIVSDLAMGIVQSACLSTSYCKHIALRNARLDFSLIHKLKSVINAIMGAILVLTLLSTRVRVVFQETGTII